MKEQEIINTALANLLYHPGIKAKWRANGIKALDGIIDLALGKEHFKLNVEIKKELRNHQLPGIFELAEAYPPLIVVAEHIFPLLKEQLRTKNIGYLETNGNIFFHGNNTFLWIEGQKPVEIIKEKSTLAFTKTGLKVLFQLLIEDHNIELPYRDLAKKADVALGNINNVLDALKEMGFILQVTKNRKTLQREKELLDRWIAGFGETLKPTLFKGTYKFLNEANFKNWRKIELDKDTVWGGEPAGDLLTNNLDPGILTIYTKLEKGDLMRKLRLIPDPNGNIEVYKKFWGDDILDKIHQPPALLTYADLLLTGDPRCQEIAKQIFNQEDLYDRFK